MRFLAAGTGGLPEALRLGISSTHFSLLHYTVCILNILPLVAPCEAISFTNCIFHTVRGDFIYYYIYH